MSKIANFPQATMIPVNGVTLEVFEAGQENKGNPIVLCHGWPELAYSWRHQIPALAAAGYHVIVPNQRGFGNSSRPKQVTDYDITHLTGDLAALLDHFGYKKAVFVGHDWGANVVWSLAQIHPARVSKIINLALPYQPRTPLPWITFMEEIFGADNYFVHFNRQPGVADAVLERNTTRFLDNLYRKDIAPTPPEPGMIMINLAQSDTPLGTPILSDAELTVYTEAFEASGFTPGINWYRNMDRNWQILGTVDPIIHAPALMIYGEQDMIPKFENLADFVPNVQVLSLECGHWVQQELPEATNHAMLEWLS